MSISQGDYGDRTAGLILGIGPAGHCDDARIGIGLPLWSEEHGQWRMWYYGRDAGFDPAAPTTLGTGYMALATSKDGLAWDRYEGDGPGGSIMGPSEDPGAFDSLHLGATDILFHEGQYWLWYLAGDRTPSVEPGGNHCLGFKTLPGLATSKDGITWERQTGDGPGGALLDAGDFAFASWPAVVHDGSRFVMYYTVSKPDFGFLSTHYAYSTDGRAWTPMGEIKWEGPAVEWDAKGTIARHVLRNPFDPAGGWLMIYSGADANPARLKQRSIAAATSIDGVSWRRLHDAPIFTVDDSDGWDSGVVTAPRLVVLEGEVRLYYLGGPPKAEVPRNPAGIGLAISSGHDLSGFVRYAA